MDIEKINGVLARALSHMDEQENLRMSEILFEDQDDGVLELPDNSPDGDPDTGGDHGVFNHDSWVDVYMAFIEEMVRRCVSEYDISEDDAMEYIVDFADELYADGQLPEMPDPETADEAEILGWVSAAKNVGFGSRFMDFVNSKASSD